jgi:hypothetical protein
MEGSMRPVLIALLLANIVFLGTSAAPSLAVLPFAVSLSGLVAVVASIWDYLLDTG